MEISTIFKPLLSWFMKWLNRKKHQKDVIDIIMRYLPELLNPYWGYGKEVFSLTDSELNEYQRRIFDSMISELDDHLKCFGNDIDYKTKKEVREFSRLMKVGVGFFNSGNRYLNNTYNDRNMYVEILETLSVNRKLKWIIKGIKGTLDHYANSEGIQDAKDVLVSHGIPFDKQ